MELIITHKRFKSSKPVIISNITMVPRIGDRINVFHTPAPIVVDVVWNFDNIDDVNFRNTILVVVE